MRFLAQLSRWCVSIQPNWDALTITIVSASLVHLVDAPHWTERRCVMWRTPKFFLPLPARFLLTSVYALLLLCHLYLCRSSRHSYVVCVRRRYVSTVSRTFTLMSKSALSKTYKTKLRWPFRPVVNTQSKLVGVGSSEPWSFHSTLVWERRQLIPSDLWNNDQAT